MPWSAASMGEKWAGQGHTQMWIRGRDDDPSSQGSINEFSKMIDLAGSESKWNNSCGSATTWDISWIV